MGSVEIGRIFNSKNIGSIVSINSSLPLSLFLVFIVGQERDNIHKRNKSILWKNHSMSGWREWKTYSGVEWLEEFLNLGILWDFQKNRVGF